MTKLQRASDLAKESNKVVLTYACGNVNTRNKNLLVFPNGEIKEYFISACMFMYSNKDDVAYMEEQRKNLLKNINEIGKEDIIEYRNKSIYSVSL